MLSKKPHSKPRGSAGSGEDEDDESGVIIDEKKKTKIESVETHLFIKEKFVITTPGQIIHNI